jgi:hypothetical protein
MTNIGFFTQIDLCEFMNLFKSFKDISDILKIIENCFYACTEKIVMDMFDDDNSTISSLFCKTTFYSYLLLTFFLHLA